MSEYDFSDDCWTEPRRYATAEVGDVFAGLPLPRVDEAIELIKLEDHVYAPVVFALALVVGLYETHVAVAPITTRADVGDAEAYDVLVESGRSAQKWARLPPCKHVWYEPALVSFFLASPLPLSLLESLRNARTAAMTDAAQALLYRRVARAWEA